MIKCFIRITLFTLLLLSSSLSMYAKLTALDLIQNERSKDTLGLFQNALSPTKCRVRTLDLSVIGLYGVSMSWLYSQWYTGYPQSRFHFFNDNSEWQQMDKFGHCWDAYNIAKPIMRCYNWAGYSERRSTLYGAGIAFLFQTTVEVFDGFSSEWGFSPGDMIANTCGVLIFAGQQLQWKEQRLVLKYSFHQTQFEKYRPQLLGSSLPENILKDYNGLTYWMTINPRAFFKESNIPRWLSMAIGFGAEGMTGGTENVTFADGKTIPNFNRYRQYYLAIDFDLARIKTRSQILSSVFKVINIIHLPAPAIEFSPGRKVIVHGFYF